MGKIPDAGVEPADPLEIIADIDGGAVHPQYLMERK